MDEDDLRARGHHVAHLTVSEPEDTLESLGLVLLELSFTNADVDEGAELSLGYRTLIILRSTDPPAEHLGDPLENQDERKQKELTPLERIGVQEGDSLRVPKGNGFWNRLSQQEQGHRAEYGRYDDAKALVFHTRDDLHAVDDDDRDYGAERDVYQVVPQQDGR